MMSADKNILYEFKNWSIQNCQTYLKIFSLSGEVDQKILYCQWLLKIYDNVNMDWHKQINAILQHNKCLHVWY